ncbi:hypothetical protein RND61_19285 [Streptomyces sp. TRM76323]|uniref:Uncharacterized protein n=1 Tax=Streptomyces tamarix TaxID=3078565 RepID=A0ABU3QN56_9ACTN|nr:hypothetical protein [Streptomyces tamarix]MDT9684188.1 hypothetical protein [Streptomyces tamarix]
MSPHDRLVDQIVFRWDTDNLSGTTGFGPVAWSCAPELADAVFRMTAPLLRATGEATAPALLRLESGDQVLLVHRAPWRDAGGRASTVCHALMGPAPVLDPATCLGLHPWSWEGGDLPLAEVRGALPPVPEGALLPAADAGQRLLAGGLARVRRELVGAVAEFLRHPNAGFTLLDPSGGAAHRVLWGLYGIFGGQITRRWTFATHDTAESDGLRFVFVSRWTGEASGSTARRRTDPAERCGDRAEAVAERLVRHQLREEYAVGAALQRAADHHRATRGGPTTLLALAEAALSGLPPLDPPPRRPAAPPPRKAPAAGPRPSPPVPVVAPEWPVPSEDRPRVRRWLGGSPHRRGPADDELLGALRTGTGYETLTALVTEAADRWPSWNREQRAALCAVLLDRELFVTDRAGTARPADDVRAANAASLYRWAVRPLLDDPDLSARVTDLLPRLSTGPHRAARAAVQQITQGPAPGLPEPAWQALLRAATTPLPRPVADGPSDPTGERREAVAANRPATGADRWEDDGATEARPGRRPGADGPRGTAEGSWEGPVDRSGGRVGEGGSPGPGARGGAARPGGGDRGREGAASSRGGAEGSWEGPVDRSGGRVDGGRPPGSAPRGDAAPLPRPDGADRPVTRGAAEDAFGADPRGEATRAREGRPPGGGPGRAPDPSGRGAVGGSPQDRGTGPADGWRSWDAGPRGETGRTAHADGGGRAPDAYPYEDAPRPAREERSWEDRPRDDRSWEDRSRDDRSWGDRPRDDRSWEGGGPGSPAGADRRGAGGTAARAGSAGGERDAGRAAPDRSAGEGDPPDGGEPPERRPVVGGRGAGEAPRGHRAEPVAPPAAPPPPARPPRPVEEGRSRGGGDARPPGDRRPPTAGPAARGGTDPPDGADRRPFVVVGVGTGVILALLGTLIALTLRACA